MRVTIIRLIPEVELPLVSFANKLDMFTNFIINQAI